MFFGLLPQLFLAISVTATPVTLKIDLHHPTVIENPLMALGGAIDGHEKGNTKEMLSSRSVKKMLQAGMKPLSYRLRTELGVEAWHWNPVGTWSDEKNKQGYWTSSTKIGDPIQVSYGYRLPRRGDTFDEANNDSYSRLDDGNPNTFWKSNPYLTSYYTGEPDDRHPQWVILDFGKKVWINAARLYWKDLYAKKFRIQYANNGAIYFGNNKPWHDFQKGILNNGHGGSELIDLGAPRLTQFVRILMTQPRDEQRGRFQIKRILVPRHDKQALKSEYALSGTAPFTKHSTDPRDQMGYALQEVEFGFLEGGKFQDYVIHRPDQKQTIVTVSSTDPWHRACDLDEKTEQPGVDAVASSGLGNQQPILWSLPVLYDTPENAGALVDYLKKRNYLFPHQRIELGEEPDGQHIDPKDFGELYCQVAAASLQVIQEMEDRRWQLGSAIKFQKSKFVCDKSMDSDSKNSMTGPKIRNSMPDPKFPRSRINEKREQKKSKLKLKILTSTDRKAIIFGGPSFVTADYQPGDTTYRFDHRLWLKPFLKELRHHDQEKDFQFLSFEWYPFDDLLLPVPELLCKQTGSLRRSMNLLRHGGVSKKMPMMITEYGYSVFSGEPEVKMEAALLNAEIVAEFLAAGGTTAYLYGYEPNTLECGMNGSWGNLMMLLQKKDQLIPLPTFYGAQIMSEIVKKNRTIFPVISSEHEVTAYAFHQQCSNQWDFLLINRNPTRSYQVILKNSGGVEKISYSSKNYRWNAGGPNGSPSKNKPPQREVILADIPIVIEPWSLTVLKKRGQYQLIHKRSYEPRD